ncbi:MAG: hypothetical protein P8J27_06425, partial [Mariniblastus sp.]|nr:hypothetical protein [Mariniblastus sp.]
NRVTSPAGGIDVSVSIDQQVMDVMCDQLDTLILRSSIGDHSVCQALQPCRKDWPNAAADQWLDAQSHEL